MKEIKINFVDFWDGFIPEESFFFNFLSQYYKVIITPTPDYLFYSCAGYQHFNYKGCVKIYFTGENLIPDFNICDYGIGFHHLQLEDRFLRFPLFLIHKNGWEDINKIANKATLTHELANRKFCNFIYSNSKGADPFREKFFHALSKYKKIDSAGKYLNNMGQTVGDKLAFIKDYKFTIAIENSAVSGYTTEKIIDPMRANSMPIYWGDPNVSTDFNESSFVHLRDYNSIEQAIEEIIRLDKDDGAYLKRISQPWFSQTNIQEYYAKELLAFFQNIFERPLDQAFRAPRYGWAKRYQDEQRRTAPLANNYFFRKIWGGIEKL